MDIQKNLLELEISAQRISDGVAAIRMMVLGLEDAGSEYTGAFYAVWDYLAEAEREFLKQLAACMEAV